jgi:hypothetical protein
MKGGYNCSECLCSGDEKKFLCPFSCVWGNGIAVCHSVCLVRRAHVPTIVFKNGSFSYVHCKSYLLQVDYACWSSYTLPLCPSKSLLSKNVCSTIYQCRTQSTALKSCTVLTRSGCLGSHFLTCMVYVSIIIIHSREQVSKFIVRFNKSQFCNIYMNCQCSLCRSTCLLQAYIQHYCRNFYHLNSN